MIIGDRLKQLREEKKMSQGDIEAKTGLLRCYVSRCENGHTVPCVETLEKWTRALGVPLFRLFYEGKVPASLKPFKSESAHKETKEEKQLRVYLSRMSDRDQGVLLKMAGSMARNGRRGVTQSDATKPKGARRKRKDGR